MKFKIEFFPARYYDKKPSYLLQVEKDYESGDNTDQSYWMPAGFFNTQEDAKIAAHMVKSKMINIQFEI